MHYEVDSKGNRKEIYTAEETRGIRKKDVSTTVQGVYLFFFFVIMYMIFQWLQQPRVVTNTLDNWIYDYFHFVFVKPITMLQQEEPARQNGIAFIALIATVAIHMIKDVFVLKLIRRALFLIYVLPYLIYLIF